MRIPPASMAFTLLLSFLVALPSFGIDMSLPALTATGAALHVAPARAGLMMSLFMLGFAFAPLLYGPASDRYGRKPVVVPEKLERARGMVAKGLTVREAAVRLKIGKTALYEALRA